MINKNPDQLKSSRTTRSVVQQERGEVSVSSLFLRDQGDVNKNIGCPVACDAALS